MRLPAAGLILVLLCEMNCNDITPRLKLTLTPDYNGTLSLTCTVNQGSKVVKTIEIGRGIAQPDWNRNRKIAKISANGEISNYLSENGEGVDGHLDPVVLPSYLRVDFHNVGCTHTGTYHCTVQGNTVVSVEGSITVCDDTAVLKLDRPDFKEPTHLELNCSLNPKRSDVIKVTYMELRRQHHQRELIAFSNDSESNGEARKFLSFTQSGVNVSGQIDSSDPTKSKLQAEFRPGLCSDAGIYWCEIHYKDKSSETIQLALAHQTHHDPCLLNPSCNMEVKYQNYYGSNPTAFSVACSCPNREAEKSEYIQLSMISDVAMSSDSEIHHIAFLDRLYDNTQLVIADDYKQKGFTGSDSGKYVFNVSTGAGHCKDMGLYRCKWLYHRFHNSKYSPEVFVREKRLESCSRGANISVTSSTTLHHLRCSVDRAFVLRLISLEVTQLMNGSMHRIAFINDFLNDARPWKVKKFGHLSISGEIRSRDPAASFISVTYRSKSNRDASSRNEKYVQCRVTYVSSKDSRIVLSVAETTLNF